MLFAKSMIQQAVGVLGANTPNIDPYLVPGEKCADPPDQPVATPPPPAAFPPLPKKPSQAAAKTPEKEATAPPLPDRPAEASAAGAETKKDDAGESTIAPELPASQQPEKGDEAGTLKAENVEKPEAPRLENVEQTEPAPLEKAEEPEVPQTPMVRKMHMPCKLPPIARLYSALGLLQCRAGSHLDSSQYGAYSIIVLSGLFVEYESFGYENKAHTSSCPQHKHSG